ncbi:saccharopine dehydrogenase [Hysterangium stoloniferum]|nr:saccharopine dehydrogenase [Hysterangium stoloniferum]
MVARPAIEEFSKREDVRLVVGRFFEGAVTAKLLDLEDLTTLNNLINKADVFLLPVLYHLMVAKVCIAHRKHMVTGSYNSPAMRALNQRSQKNTVKSFISFCGGLPTPETADVPLGYKFSWSPRGVLGAALNEARFKLFGTEFKIPGNDLLQSYSPSIPQSKFLKLEGIANSSLDNVLRGTLRIGLLETDRTISINNWCSFASRTLASKFAISLAYDDPTEVLDMPEDELSELLQALSWLGISPMLSLANTFSHSKHHSIPVPSKQLAPIDLLTIILSHRLQYQPNERDMVVLMHEITVSSEPPSSQLLPPSSGQSDVKAYTSTLVAYGSPTSTAMSRTVGIPVALAALTVLDGGVGSR